MNGKVIKETMESENITYEIRNYEECVEVFKAFNNGEIEIFEDEQKLEKYAKKVIKNGHLIVDRKEGRPVGVVSFYCNDTVSKTAYVTMLILSNRLGFAKGHTFFRLCAKAIELVNKTSMERIRIEVKENNTKARILYEHMGFKYTEEKGNDSLYMEISLEDYRKNFKKRTVGE